MAAYQSTHAAGSARERLGPGDAGSAKARPMQLQVTTALATGDTIAGPTIPAGSLLLDVYVSMSKLDTNGSPAMAYTLGTAAAPASIITAAGGLAGRNGGVDRPNAPAAVPVVFVEDTQLLLTVTAGPATGATTGVVSIVASYYPKFN